MDKPIQGVISAPQFDITAFRPGTPLRVQGKAGTSANLYRLDTTALVTTANPLKLKIAYVKTRTTGNVPSDEEEIYDSIDTLTIDINQVASGEVRIKFLVPKEDPKNE